ncbi:MAG: hypothetical protein DMG12_24445 [Acidobacteria bacterium]|nr:MAG: hypothetical protein DMG12_24445 [Acidobacteriota bacterium]
MTDMGLNSLEVKDGKQAADTFEKCLKEFPNSRHRPEWTLNLAERPRECRGASADREAGVVFR